MILTNVRTQSPEPSKGKKRKRRETDLAFCECGRRLTCWLCLGKGTLSASPHRQIREGDACHGCSGVGRVACRGCTPRVFA